MRPSTELSAEGPSNLYNAMSIAANPEARGRGVLVVANDTLHAARALQKTHDPDCFDVLRITKLPKYENEFGEDGRTYFSVRQSRFGVKGFVPTSMGEVKTIFEWELFGVGVDAGQTTIRLHLSGSDTGWGLHASTNLKAGSGDLIRASDVVQVQLLLDPRREEVTAKPK